MASWDDQFREVLFTNLSKDVSYDVASGAMKRIVKSKLLTHTDLHDNPERFFLAHRLLAEHAVKLGPGHWIRFTVHYNLCVGTVLAVGNDEQVPALFFCSHVFANNVFLCWARKVKSLASMQSDGLLGCFGLTERFAGVNSGMFVEVWLLFHFYSIFGARAGGSGHIPAVSFSLLPFFPLLVRTRTVMKYLFVTMCR